MTLPPLPLVDDHWMTNDHRYTADQMHAYARAALAQPAPLPAREPLTAARLLDISDDFKSRHMHGGTMFDEFDALGCARAVEHAHGITATPAAQEQT